MILAGLCHPSAAAVAFGNPCSPPAILRPNRVDALLLSRRRFEAVKSPSHRLKQRCELRLRQRTSIVRAAIR